jgi:hypothetical protein
VRKSLAATHDNPEFCPWDPCGKRRELTLSGRPLNFTHTLWQTYPIDDDGDDDGGSDGSSGGGGGGGGDGGGGGGGGGEQAGSEKPLYPLFWPIWKKSISLVSPSYILTDRYTYQCTKKKKKKKPISIADCGGTHLIPELRRQRQADLQSKLRTTCLGEEISGDNLPWENGANQ